MALTPKVKLKTLMSFPATVLDGAGVDVVKANGNYQFNIAFDDFAPPVTELSDAAHQNALLWNSVTNRYVLAPISLLGTGTTTVAALPTPNINLRGMRTMVSDANAVTFMSTVAGGGANIVPVVCDGANWKIG
jgi:hypothetical protein